jgi:opacity protein-like surface antigen
MKNLLIIIFTAVGIIGNAQIITNEAHRQEAQPVQNPQKEVKSKTGTEIYFGISPAYTYRTLTTNDGLFAQPIGYRADETAEWTTGFNAGIRNKINSFLKFEIGVGYSSNKEAYDYTEGDSVFRYTNTYRHISFPIRLAYTYGDEISFYGGIGVIPKAFLSMKREETSLDINNKEATNETVERDKFNMFLIDAVATIGTQIKFSPNYGVFIMAEARRQLNNNFNSQSPYIRKPYALGFNVGIEIYL